MNHPSTLTITPVVRQRRRSLRGARLVPIALLLASGVGALADEGMWLPNRPPTKLLKEKYGFEPTAAWLEHVQKASVKIGASGSLVSPRGLILTNHHVGSGQLEKLSTPERNLMRDGFYARTPAEELKCADMEVRLLWTIEDVTDKVNAAAKPEMSAADAFSARRKRMSEIEQEAKDRTKLDCEIVTLYQGARYHLYSYRRYTDVRLVMAPEKSIAFFGGDNDNFEYPRYDLDMCFFRVYENDEPLKCEHYLKWSRAGAAENDLVLVAGHPGRTRRLNTLDHLRFLRDVDFPFNLRNAWRREVQLKTFVQRGAENARIGENDLFGTQNGRKAMTGGFGGLLDPVLMQRKASFEKDLRAAVMNNPQQQAQWGDAWDNIATALQQYREFHARYAVIRGALRSDLFRLAHTLVQLAAELPKPSRDRLREYRESELESVYLRLYSPAPIYDELEIDRLAGGLMLMAETLGGDDPTVAATLAGMSPRERAVQLVRGCTLKDVETRKKLAAGGAAAIAASDDPLIKLAAALDPEYRALRTRFEDTVEGVERANYAKVAAAMFARFGEDLYPDATGTLRLAFGPVKGYQEDSRDVPPFTNFAGLYQRWQERHGEEGFELPQRWVDGKSKLKLDTPYNFVCTADIIGGNSGSPVINTAGEVVGLIFDGNLQSLVWDIQFDERQGRAVAVDSRAIIEALRKIYDAGALADELTGAGR
ncbi:MAG: Dipeptidyl-peptidase 7 [Phycisphaerae bacterium]|nr:Dipeptidyl-peptidase 7 [Phycisphaerae bacterium]